MRRAVLVLCSLSLLVAAGCSRDAPPPQALRAYLDALRDGDLGEAYRRTQLSALAGTPGASLSQDHFEAFFRANPLRGYAIRRVTRIDQRPIENPHEPGTPFYDIDIELEYDHGVSHENVAVEGDVLPRVIIDPARVFIRARPGLERVVVDGVRTSVAAGNEEGDVYPILVIPGPHTIDIAGRTVRITTEPLGVVDGPASLSDDGITIELER